MKARLYTVLFSGLVALGLLAGMVAPAKAESQVLLEDIMMP